MDGANHELSPGEPGKDQDPLSEIDSHLVTLKSFETDLQNDRVDRAIEILRSTIDPYFEELDDLDVVPIYYGSLQYKDPKNLDADLYFASEHAGYNELQDISNTVQASIDYNPEWPGGLEFSDFSETSIDEIEEGSLRVPSDAVYDYDEDVLDGFRPEMYAAFILSSVPLYESQREKLEKMQERIRGLAENHKWLREGIKEKLDDCIANRQNYRKDQGVA